VSGTLVCARAVLPRMIARRRGRIINISSSAANRGATYQAGYAASKAAALRLTEQLAEELAEHNIPVFALDPGLVYTPMAEFIFTSAEGKQWLPGFPRAWEERAEPPERVGAAVVWLASGQGDALSGRFLQVSDDLVAFAGRASEIQKRDLRTLRIRPGP
jgi:NAD(P)-dependent dehydrogenase (short-subunit alcohol dehydrogenase family)